MAEETARLEELKEARQQREAADRSELADRLAVDTSPEGERVRRYQLDCDRKLHRALQSLLKLRRDEGGAADPDAEDVPDPAGPVEPPNGLTPAVTDFPVTVPIPPGAVEPPDRPAPTATVVPVTASGPVEPESGLTPTATGIPAIAMATAEAIEPEDGEDGRRGSRLGPSCRARGRRGRLRARRAERTHARHQRRTQPAKRTQPGGRRRRKPAKRTRRVGADRGCECPGPGLRPVDPAGRPTVRRRSRARSPARPASPL